MMNKIIIILILLLAGCSNSDEWAEQFIELEKNCEGTVTITAHYGNLVNSFEITCEYEKTNE